MYPKWFRDAIQQHGREGENPPGRSVSTTALLRHVHDAWDGAISLDLDQFWGVDLFDERLLKERPWWWLRARIFGLLDITDSRLRAWVQEVAQ